MEKRAAEEFLWRYRDAKQECRRLEGEYHELLELQEGAKAIQYSNAPASSGKTTDLSDLMVRREKYLDRILHAKRRMQDVFFQITDAIDRLSKPEQKEVLSLRYLQLDGCRPMRWEDIASAINCQPDHVYKVYREALKDFEIG